jgi:toxin ParE1/3/4
LPQGAKAELESVGQIIKSPEAAADLSDIWEFVGQSNEGAADRLLDEIDRKLRLLSDSPYMGRERTDIRPGLRSFPVGSYVIFYNTIDDGIEIVRVLHGARDIENLF